MARSIEIKKMDRAWIFSFFGTAIGSGILFIPLQAGKSGIYVTVVTMCLAFTVTYFAQKYYALMLLKAENASSYNDVIQEFCGKGFSIFISYFFALQLFASVLVYTTGLNANVGEFLFKYNITPVNLSSYKIFPFIIIVALTIILMLSERTVVKALDKLSAVLIILIAIMVILFIPFWHIVEFKHLGGSTQTIVKNFLMSFPLYMGAINFYPTLSPMIMFYRENYDMDREELEKKAVSLNKYAIYLLSIFTGIFVLSSALTLTPESIHYALQKNLSSLAVIGFNEVSASATLNIIKFLSYIVIFFALISSFYGLMLAAVEIVAARLYPSRISNSVRRKIAAIIVMFFLWVFTTFNMNVIDHSVFRWSSLLYEFGGSIFNKKNEVVINNKAGINALNLFINMQKNYIINPNVWLPINSIDANSLFMSGEYGFYIGGSWLLAGYKDLPFQWDVTYMPIGTRRSSTLGCKLIAAVKNSGHEESAKLFIKYISSKKVSDYLCSNTLSISPRIDGADISYPSCSNYISIFRNELLNTPVISVKDWSHPHIDIVNFVLKTAIHQAINGLAPQKALDKAAKTIKTLEDSKYKNISATLAGQSKMKIH